MTIEKATEKALRSAITNLRKRRGVCVTVCGSAGMEQATPGVMCVIVEAIDWYRTPIRHSAMAVYHRLVGRVGVGRVRLGRPGGQWRQWDVGGKWHKVG